jgi:hypothetical protein
VRDAGRPAHVEDLGVWTKHDPAHLGVAGETASRLRGHRTAPLQLGRGSTFDAQQGGERDGDLEMGALPATLGKGAGIEGRGGEVDQAIGEAPLPAPMVVGKRGGEGFEGRADGRPAFPVEVTAHPHAPALGSLELEEALLTLQALLAEEAPRIEGVAEVLRLLAELGEGSVPRAAEKPSLVKGLGAAGLLRPLGGAGDEGKMRKADVTGTDGLGGLGEAWSLLAGHESFPRGGAGGVTLLFDPVDGAGAALPLVLTKLGELGGTGGELEEEAVDDPADADELVADEGGGAALAGAHPEGLDRDAEKGDLVDPRGRSCSGAQHYMAEYTNIRV